MKAISLFSGGGIGDLGLRGAGVSVVIANELLKDRADVLAHNFPKTKVISGDIHDAKNKIVEKTKELLHGEELFLILATPPCQGMSSNGLGKLLNEIKKGSRPKIDPRNELILPTLQIIKDLKPRWVIFENVVGMENTAISYKSKLVKILDVIRTELSPDYLGAAHKVEFADYGVPQRRTRLITIYTRDENGKKMLRTTGSLLAPNTHNKQGTDAEKWISVIQAIGHLPPLDSKSLKTAKSTSVMHQVPVLDENKYFWISNTPVGETAFNNQCINLKCGYQANPKHGSIRLDGVNKAKEDTPLNCIKCGSLLPRPWVVQKNGKKRIMKGFISAYKRMDPDLPAPTLTTNFTFPCSDHKVHPLQNRVLSYTEAMIIQTIANYDFNWKFSENKDAPLSTIREIIGESVPPLFIETQCRYIQKISKGQIEIPKMYAQAKIS